MTPKSANVTIRPLFSSMAIIGAHVSAAGGLHNCFANAEAIGAECLQIFGASPRQWTANLPSAAAVKQFKAEEKRSGLGPVFLHAAYLVNLGSSLSELRSKSVASLASHLKIAELIGARGLIFHIGSAGKGSRREAIELVAHGMKSVLDRVPGKAQLIMENGAGGGGKLGATPEEIGEIFRLVKNKRVKVCLDTQHAFAAGVLASYSPEEIRATVKRFDDALGWENVVALHANDSQSRSGSFHDRHENIGEGYIGLGGFRNLAADPDINGRPWILEVPGFANDGPDARNVAILKKIFGQAAAV